MDSETEHGRDLANVVVAQVGGLVATGDPWVPHRLVDRDGAVVEAVSAWFAELQAAGRSAATERSYGMDLLRWFRFLWTVGVAWDRATRAEARDFCRWLQVAAKPTRVHWRHRGNPGSGAVPASTTVAYSASVRAHSETVLRGFYEFHREAGTGPILNPFPLDRSRSRGRAHAHHNPMEPHRNERTGRYRPTVPTRVPRNVPDVDFNEIFARLGSHRDRALVAFYVSTGARASELLSATVAGVDPGRQLISVVRKGSGVTQELPASTDAFVWLRLYQLEMDGAIPAGRRQPLWWTSRRPVRPLTYHAVHRMFERVNVRAGTAATLHSLRHTAAYRMAEDPALPLTDVAVDRRAAGVGSRATDHNPDLLDAPQGGRDPPGPGPSRRADPAGRGARRGGAGAGLPTRDARRALRGRPFMSVTVDDLDRTTTPPSPSRTQGPFRFEARGTAGSWPATRQCRDEVVALMASLPFVSEADEEHRALGVNLLADWLGEQPGRTWQERWVSSGADTAGAAWRQVPAVWLRSRGDHFEVHRAALVAALPVAVCADVVRPSLSWLAGGGVAQGGLLVRHLAAARDVEGFARLRTRCDGDPGVSTMATSRMMYRCALMMAAKGGVLADITVGDIVELFDAEADVRVSPSDGRALLYRTLHNMGVLNPTAPPTLRALRTAGQRTPDQLIDRYHLACHPIRDLLVDYLRERQPALDYNSLDSLANYLGKLFWADLEAHHPGIDSLRLPVGVADAWKRRLQTIPKTILTATGDRGTVAVPRINYRECLTPVRSFYLDLAHWAVDDPGRWASWVAPCPVGEEEINRKKDKRRRKSRMDARTRERLPVLPVVVRTVEERRKTAAALLEAARLVEPGEPFTAGATTLTRAIIGSRSKSGLGKVWADDPTTGKRRDLSLEDANAFWAWAVVEVLRATGIRAEELLELSHHSLVKYRLPTTGEIVPLLQIVPSKTDAERLLVVSPQLADVLSAIIRRVRGTAGSVPLVPAYDGHERVWSPPAPLLFQRHVGNEDRAFSSSTIRDVLARALAHTGLVDHVDGRPLDYTPHDFRRMFITEAIMNGLPPHIAQVIAGHRDINVTLGYKAVYPEEAIQAHLAFLARRRALRPSDEYRVPTDTEWQEFLGHFERRKVSIGTCARAFSTPCIHEHACVRCPMLWPDPAQRPRLIEIRDNLNARVTEANNEGWHGEVEGLQISLAGANNKLAQIDDLANTTPS